MEDTFTHPQMHAALEAQGLDTETWNTGGGCLMTVAVIERGGSPITYGNVPSGKTQAVRYVGVTWEGYWVICEYDENSDRDELQDGLLLEGVYAQDLDGMARFVADHVDAAKSGVEA